MRYARWFGSVLVIAFVAATMTPLVAAGPDDDESGGCVDAYLTSSDSLAPPKVSKGSGTSFRYFVVTPVLNDDLSFVAVRGFVSCAGDPLDIVRCLQNAVTHAAIEECIQ